MTAVLLLVACRTDPIVAAERFFATRPVYERPLDAGRAPADLDLRASSCGACHPDAYAEWQVSTHAHAWKDPQLQAEMTKSENRWMCQNCHAPLMVQQAAWPSALVDGDVEKPVWVENPAFDEDLREEGITCAACHLRDGVIHGPTGVATSAHETRADADFTGTGLCERCHEATATYPGKGFVCTFQTGTELAAGPYGQGGATCQMCHMPAVTRPDGTLAHRHWWPGGGIPKVAGVGPPADALPVGLRVAVAQEGAELRVDLVNAAAGHMLPTGDPERFYRVALTFDTGASWEHRIGQTWEWWPEPKKLADNRIPPGTSRAERVPVPPGATAVELVVTRHRMTAEAAAFHHLDGYPTDAEVERRTIPLR